LSDIDFKICDNCCKPKRFSRSGNFKEYKYLEYWCGTAVCGMRFSTVISEPTSKRTKKIWNSIFKGVAKNFEIS